MSKLQKREEFKAYARLLAADGFIQANMSNVVSAVATGPVAGAEHVTSYQLTASVPGGLTSFALGIETRHAAHLEWFLNGGLAECECCGHA